MVYKVKRYTRAGISVKPYRIKSKAEKNRIYAVMYADELKYYGYNKNEAGREKYKVQSEEQRPIQIHSFILTSEEKTFLAKLSKKGEWDRTELFFVTLIKKHKR